MQIVYFILALTFASCATVDTSSEAKNSAASVESELVVCRPSNIRCSKAVAPTFCYADVQLAKSKKVEKEASKETTGLVHLYAWGYNRCSAMNNMNTLFCKKKMSTPQPLQISCQPDASNGHCPAKELDCGEKLEPASCFAGYYGAQPMSPDQAITTKGINSCEARNKLYKEACRKNMDPLMLERISCEADLNKNGGN